MLKLEVYDPPMCCSTGICGPEVNPVLVHFAADLKWLEDQGVAVERYNLAQSPIAFAENDLVCSWLSDKGEKALPLLIVEGKVAASGFYPVREELAGFLGLDGAKPSQFTPAEPGGFENKKKERSQKKTIEILGIGCPKCKKLTEHAETAVKQLGADYTIEKVSDINDIIRYGVMMTPALAINGEVKAVGKVLTVEEIKKILNA